MRTRLLSAFYDQLVGHDCSPCDGLRHRNERFMKGIVQFTSDSSKSGASVELFTSLQRTLNLNWLKLIGNQYNQIVGDATQDDCRRSILRVKGIQNSCWAESIGFAVACPGISNQKGCSHGRPSGGRIKTGHLPPPPTEKYYELIKSNYTNLLTTFSGCFGHMHFAPL